MLFSFCLLMASCSIVKSNVTTSEVKAPVLTTTVATLKVAEKPITYTYVPSKYESKHSSFGIILENAKYAALKENGGDVLVQVSYRVEGKGMGMRIRKVKTLTITGYPATYTNFRTPSEEDRENVRAFYKDEAGVVVHRNPLGRR